MKHSNIVEFKVFGEYALFSDPVTRVGGEKCSYQIPTYEALKGVLHSVYWRPTFIWVIDEVRIMKPIQTQSSGIRPIIYAGGNTLATYTYLKNVEYQVRAHFIWNENRPELSNDRNENKHHNIAKRMINKGGRRDIFLGTRECQGYVEPCVFGEEKGFYDEQVGELSFGQMFHGFTYPDEAVANGDKGKVHSRFWRPVMQKGVVKFPHPEEVATKKYLKNMNMKIFDDTNLCSISELEEEVKHELV